MQTRICLAFLALSVVTAFSQPTTITYQGHLTSNGTNVTGAGQFKFALVTSTNANHTATATANAPSGGYITGYTVTFGGNGYVTAPAVTVFGGGGTGAAAHANLSGDSVVSLTVDNPGNGNYATAPAVLIAPPPANLSYTTYWSNDGTSANGSEPFSAVTINVSNGLFTANLGDTSQPNMSTIPASLFTQSNLQLRVWFNDGTHGFAALDPAQNLTPTPYANFANNANNAAFAATANIAATASTANNVPSSALSGVYTNALTLNNTANVLAGDGSGLTALNASQLIGQVPTTVLNNAWKIGGNTGANPTNGAFIGTTDSAPLEFRANAERALRLEPTPSANPTRATNAPNVIGGANGNFVSNTVAGATIAGGGASYYGGDTNLFNTVSGDFGTIGGGISNTVTKKLATIAGGSLNLASGDVSAVGGGVQNVAGGNYSTIAGGQANSADGLYATVGGGSINSATAFESVVAGGANNAASGNASFVGGGTYNSVGFAYSTIGGGFSNRVTAQYAFVGGGGQNAISGSYANIGGGANNTAMGGYSAIPGGLNNTASGLSSLAAGSYAQAAHDHSFVWSDGFGSTPYSSTGAYQFCVQAGGGVHLSADLSFDTTYHHLSMTGGNAAGYLYGSFAGLADGIHLGYNYYYDAAGTGHVANSSYATSRISAGFGQIVMAISTTANAAPQTTRLLANASGVTVYGTFNNSSDRNVKQDIAPINAADILDRVTRLPLSEWSYKDDPQTRHIGPMGQDFYAAFNIGTDEKHIAPIDEAGVAFASIQALNKKVTDLSEQLERRDAENANLKTRLERLEKALTALAGSKK